MIRSVTFRSSNYLKRVTFEGNKNLHRHTRKDVSLYCCFKKTTGKNDIASSLRYIPGIVTYNRKSLWWPERQVLKCLSRLNAVPVEYSSHYPKQSKNSVKIKRKRLNKKIKDELMIF